MDLLKFRRLWTLVGYGLVILVVVLSLFPSSPPSLDFSWADKVTHVLAYGVLMLWFAQLYPKSRYGWLACGFIVLGILLEVLQLQLDSRRGDVWDVAANSLGTVLSWGLALMGMSTLLHQFEKWCLKYGKEG